MKDLYRLKFITRYSNVPRVRDESVAEHSFFVASIAMQLMDKFPDADRAKVIGMATIHDWAEAHVDDVAHDVKRDYPKVGRALKDAEAKVMKRYGIWAQELYEEYEKGVSLEARIVKYCDIKQCVQYLQTEVDMGNKYMQPLLDDSQDLLQSYEIVPMARQTVMEL